MRISRDTCSNFKNGKITVVVNPGLVVWLRGLIVGTFLDEFQMNESLGK